MEEDIKYELEDLSHIHCFQCIAENGLCPDCYIDIQQIQAIANLIKGYKDLEEEHQKRIMLALNKELVIVNSKMYTIDKELYNDLLEDTVNNYIPKSKVREKIEELEKQMEKDEVDDFGIHSIGWSALDYIVDYLRKELLQEGDDK